MYNKVDKFKEIVDEMLDLYQRKQSDYGDSAGKTFDEYGLVSFLVRIEDKLNRVSTLTKKSSTEQQVKFLTFKISAILYNIFLSTFDLDF